VNNETKQIEIDSIKFSISLDLIKINPKADFFDKWFNWNETKNEIYSLPKRTAHHHIDKIGYKYDYWIGTQNRRGYIQRYLYIAIHSKMLEARYFEGITQNNIKVIYDEIMRQGVVSFTYEHFLKKSFCTDVDFKRDFYCPQPEYHKHLNQLMSLTPARKDMYGCKKYKAGRNWNGRATNDPSAHPNFKFYDKDMELMDKDSYKFKEQYIQQDTDNLKRLEFTLKSEAHIKRLGIHDTSLFTLLNLTQKQKEDILEQIVNKCINLNFSIINDDADDEKGITPIQQILLNSLKVAMRNTHTLQDAMNSLTTGLSTKNKYKYFKKYNDLYEKYLFETNDDYERIQNNFKLWSLLLQLDTIKEMVRKNQVKTKSDSILKRIISEYEHRTAA
jgi:hypothetical protein